MIGEGDAWGVRSDNIESYDGNGNIVEFSPLLNNNLKIRRDTRVIDDRLQRETRFVRSWRRLSQRYF